MDNKYLLRVLGYLISGVLLSLSTQVVADAFYGSIAAVSGVSDNALKAADDTVSERQEQYSLNLGSDWTNSLLAFHLGYGARAQTFSEDSQPEKNYLEGSSSLMIGKSTQPVNLLLEHSRTTLLNAPDSLNLTGNQDEKDIFSARPTLRQHLSPVDDVLLNGEYSRINYMENEIKDSRREGGTLVLEHRFSALDNIQLSAQQTEVDFKRLPYANYTYSSVGITYAAKLRKISYSATVGNNKTSPDIGKEYSSPSYALDGVYEFGGQKFSVDVNRTLTDTSAADGITLPKSELPISDLPTTDGGNVTPDQIERENIGLNWSTFVVCQGCTLALGISQTKDKYLNTGETATERGWNSGLSYALSAASSVSLRIAGGDHKYSKLIIGNDYKIQTSRLEYIYQVSRAMDVNAVVKKEKRYGEFTNQRYVESYLGAGMNYKF